MKNWVVQVVKYFSAFALYFVLVCSCQPSVAETARATTPKVPSLLLAQVYQRGLHVPDYLVSEKYDGVRALWDGQQLVTRAGHVIQTPVWFTHGFPKQALDGELWLARGEFDTLSGAVRKHVPIDAEWRNVRYLIFELPNAGGTFEARARRIQQLVMQAKVPHLQAVKQVRLKDQAALQRQLNAVVAQGGEGLMLHRADAHYVTGRSDVLLKLKPTYDAEATVVGHTAGRGKYQGKLGALVVETNDGVRFKLGTGLTDAQRANPPKIGSVVTYTYQGLTIHGKPKFA